MGAIPKEVIIATKKKIKIKFDIEVAGGMEIDAENAPSPGLSDPPPNDATFRRVAWKKTNPYCFWIEIAPGTWLKVCV